MFGVRSVPAAAIPLLLACYVGTEFGRSCTTVRRSFTTKVTTKWKKASLNCFLIISRNLILAYASTLSDHEILSVCRHYGSAKVSHTN